jgi:proline dehydrogenase
MSKKRAIPAILAEPPIRTRGDKQDVMLGPMRTILLWMARNRWLRDRLPRLWFAKRAVRRFMPGEDAESAISAAEVFRSQGIVSMFTRLGENITRLDEADAVAEHYLGLMDTIAARGLDGEVSVKLTQLGYDLDPDRALAHVERLAERAAGQGRTVWVDMEGSEYVEGTISLYERLKASHPNTGLCLQAYLKRTAADVQRLLPLDPSIRLVKGAYAEPATIAYQSRSDVDANFVALAVAMLEGVRSGRVVGIGLGTHDVRLVEQIASHAAAMGLDRTAFEVEMLYGIRSAEQRRLASEGYRVRDLIAYGEAWYPWYMRRLAERPANVIFALRQLLP